jgi:Prenyltransferase and squalene oxidase repeat
MRNVTVNAKVCEELDAIPSRRRAITYLAGSALGGFSFLGAVPCIADDIPARTDLDGLYDKEVDEAIRNGLKLLVSRQNPDGSFLSNEWGREAGVCSLVGLALLSRGIRSGYGQAGKSLQLVGRYICEHAQESGFIHVQGASSHGPMYGHGFATLFLSELYGSTPANDIRPKLSAAVDLIVRSQNNQGGWRYEPRPFEADLSVTVCQVMALRAARNAGIGVPKETIDRAVDYIRRSQNADGGYMYQLTGGASRFPLTAAAVVALYNAGIYEGTEIDSAIAYLQNNISNASSLDRNGFFYYSHYYSAQAFWHRGGQAWDQWYSRLKRILLSLRNAQGGWFDYNSIEYGTAMACLILNMPRTVLPIFQR